ncbi:MAG: HPP family protein [Dehalococcoidales bacterium]|nr:HPP family protein [Dehalococcoidales bacterium]
MKYLYRRGARIRHDFKLRWKNYFIQSLLAVIVVVMLLWILKAVNAVVIASIGASAFIVFTMPRFGTAQPRRIIGGHIIGLVCGSLAGLIPHANELSTILILALAVGLSMLLMVSLDMEHPPASATALGLALNGYSTKVVMAVLTSAIVLSLAHRFFKKYLRDLV